MNWPYMTHFHRKKTSQKNSSSLFVGDITHMIPKMSENSSSLHLINRVTARSLHRLDLEVHGRHCASFFSSEVTTWIFVELSLLKGCIRENQANKKNAWFQYRDPDTNIENLRTGFFWKESMDSFPVIILQRHIGQWVFARNHPDAYLPCGFEDSILAT